MKLSERKLKIIDLVLQVEDERQITLLEEMLGQQDSSNAWWDNFSSKKQQLLDERLDGISDDAGISLKEA